MVSDGELGQHIPRYEHIKYDEFLRNHLILNQPLILLSNHTQGWACRAQWRLPFTHESRGFVSSPNLKALRQYGEQIIPVANTSKREYSEFERTEQTLAAVLDLWESGKGDSLYVKDWHLIAEIEASGKGARDIYEVPEIFRDDWLNPPYSFQHRTTSLPDVKTYDPTSTSDFRFTYLGPAGTFTPLHRDVYASYSWSANIVGRKMWWLFPPGTVDSLRDRNGNLPFDVRDLPAEKLASCIQVTQQEGEIVFVPSGWYHQVLNLDFCISINHNFFSSTTLPLVFKTQCHAQAAVEEALSDVKAMIQDRLGHEVDEDGVLLSEKEWVEEVQKVVKLDAGWNWEGFYVCILDNLQAARAPAHLRPSQRLLKEAILSTVQLMKEREDITFLPAVRELLVKITSLLDRM